MHTFMLETISILKEIVMKCNFISLFIDRTEEVPIFTNQPFTVGSDFNVPKMYLSFFQKGGLGIDFNVCL